MKLLFFSITLLLADSAFSAQCRDVNFNGTRRLQNVRTLSGQNNKTEGESFLGDDIVYEGAPCPDGKVCVEMMYNILRSSSEADDFQGLGALKGTHGQVLVIDKASGNLSELRPLKFTNGSKDLNGIPFVDRGRWTRFCEVLTAENIRSWGERGVGPEALTSPCKDAESYPYGAKALDIYSYRCDWDKHTRSPLLNEYCGYNADSKARALEVLNSGDVSRPSEWAQTRSIQEAGGGSFARVATTLGLVRRSLGCEPQPQNLQERIAHNLEFQKNDFPGCLSISLFSRSALERNIKPDLNNFSIGPTQRPSLLTEDIPRAEAPQNNRRKRDRRSREQRTADEAPLVRGVGGFRVPTNCVSEQTVPGVEVVTCQNGPLEPVNPNATLEERKGRARLVSDPIVVGVDRSQDKVVFRLVNNRIEAITVENNYTYLQDFSVTCEAQEQTGERPSGSSEGSSGASRQ